MKVNSEITAKIFSYLFVPPVMTLIIFAEIGLNSNGHFSEIFLNALLFGFVLPIAVFVYLRKKNLVVNDDAVIKEERTLPYLIGALLTLVAFFVSWRTTGFSLATSTWVIYFVTSLLITAINKFWKISAHAMGVGIPLGVTLFEGNSLSLFFAVVLVIVFWARLKLRVHTPMQVVAGALTGIFVSLAILYLR